MTEAGRLTEIALPPPEMTGPGAAILEALARRSTIRQIAPTALAPALLSKLLWAAWGINREQGAFGEPGRTAASASNSQEIDLYVLLESGAYRYDARAHRLTGVLDEDIRALALTPGQRGVNANAPAQLVFVADVERLIHSRGFQEPGLQDPETQKSYFFVDAGLIAANIYLFAAAEGLAAWFHNCDKAGLARKLGLRAEQRPLFAQSVGYREGAESQN
jgi:nitroreductase